MEKLQFSAKYIYYPTKLQIKYVRKVKQTTYAINQF